MAKKLARKPVVGSGFGPPASRDDIQDAPPPAAQQPTEVVNEPEPDPAQDQQDVIDSGDPAVEPAAAALTEPEPDATAAKAPHPASKHPVLQASEADHPADAAPAPAPRSDQEKLPADEPAQDEPQQEPNATAVQAAPADRSRLVGRRTGKGVGWARREIDRSTLSARQRMRGAWTAAPVRFSAALQALLTARLVDDQERTGDYRLSLNHLVSAALRQIPADPREAAQWAQRFQDFLGTRAPATVGTKMSLETSVAEAMPRLQAHLRRDYRYGLIGYVQSWAIIELLADLDAADIGEPDVRTARQRVLDRLSQAMGGP